MISIFSCLCIIYTTKTRRRRLIDLYLYMLHLQSQLSPAYVDGFFNLLSVFIFLEMLLSDNEQNNRDSAAHVIMCPPSFTYLVLRTASNILTNITGWTAISEFDVAVVFIKNVRLHTYLIDCLVRISLYSQSI